MAQHDIPMNAHSEAFAEMWRAAGTHLSNKGDHALPWLRSNLVPPIIEHLSFRIGNQIILIRVEDVDGRVNGPGSFDGLQVKAKAMNATACLMPMRKGLKGNWQPAESGWGLVDLDGRFFDPIASVSIAPLEMSAWELRDFAVQIVRDDLKSRGRQIMSSCGDLGVDPGVWFVGDSGPEWVVVRPVCYPETEAAVPSNLDSIKTSCARTSEIGHFALVRIKCLDQAHGGSEHRLLRGEGMEVTYDGLRPL